MKEIENINNKGEYHGYQEWYFFNGQLMCKCFFNNGIKVNYQEYYEHINGNLEKRFYI